METTELRIGNYVLINSNIEVINMITEIQLGYSIRSECNIDEVKPIQLTKKWLIDFGFEEYKDTLNFTIQTGTYYDCSQVEKHTKLKIKLTNAGNWRVENFANKSIYLKYIHQLQNLYFALTNNELISNN